MDHRQVMKRMRDDAPSRRNGSPQFIDDDVNAHDVHTGRKGGNKIDNGHGAAIGNAMLQALAAGQLKLDSVTPAEMNDPKALKALNDSIDRGDVKVRKIVTSQISEVGQPRRKGLDYAFDGGSLPELSIVYQIPS